MFDYQAIAAEAAALLAEFGQEAVITAVGQTRYDPATLTHTADTVPYRGRAAAFAYRQNEIDGTRIVAGDVKIYLERVQAAPKVGDSIAVNGRDWRIMDVSPLAPAGYAVLYVLQGRAQ